MYFPATIRFSVRDKPLVFLPLDPSLQFSFHWWFLSLRLVLAMEMISAFYGEKRDRILIP